jgi:hypothetical protein
MKLPYDIARKIALRAVELAKEMAPKATGRGAEGLQPSYSDGVVGITTTPETSYMMVQNYGMDPRIMDELAGRTIPIRTPNGRIVFRSASYKNIGNVKIISRDERGEVVSKISWRHPGLKGLGFIEKSIQQATLEWMRSASPNEVLRVLNSSSVSNIVENLQEGI